jgi:hypothetical protein
MSCKTFFKLLIASLFVFNGYVQCMDQSAKQEENIEQEENKDNQEIVEKKVEGQLEELQKENPGFEVLKKKEKKGTKYIIQNKKKIIATFVVILGIIIIYFLCPEAQAFIDNMFKKIGLPVTTKKDVKTDL